MLPMLKLDTNSGFHELFINFLFRSEIEFFHEIQKFHFMTLKN